MSGSPGTFTRPPLDGSLNLLQIIQFNEEQNPRHPALRYSAENGIQDICWQAAVLAFRRVACAIMDRRAAHHQERPVVAILGSLDTITYFSVTIGIMLAGCVPFPISTRNTPAAIVDLLSRTGCNWVVATSEPATSSVLEHLSNDKRLSNIDIQPIPTFSSLYEADEQGTSKNGILPLPNVHADTLCIILHSSGTLSTPKPVLLSYDYVFINGKQPLWDEIDFNGQILSAHAIPMYHMMGFITLLWTTMLGLTIVVFPPSAPMSVPSPELVLSDARATRCTILYCVPVFLEIWARTESNIQALKSFNSMWYAGGPLAKPVGDKLTKEGINIVGVFGSTETGGVSLMSVRPPKEGWEWLQLTPMLDLTFIPQPGLQDLFKMVVKVGEFRKPAVINTHIDGVPGYDTNDLVIRHPQNPTLFKFYGRDDDQITHSTGEKTNPLPIESMLMQDPNIRVAVMFGSAKFQPGVLILPSEQYEIAADDVKALAKYRNIIWDTVSRVNKMVPQHSRIFKGLIILSRQDKPFEFTAKGTPKRQKILNKYEDDIDKAYKAYDDVILDNAPTVLSSDFETIIHSVRTIVHKILETSIADNQDIFQAGADSLCAVSIRNTIVSRLHQTEGISLAQIRKIPYDFVYKFPSICTLAAFIFGWNLANDVESVKDTGSSMTMDTTRGIQKPFSKDEVIVELQSGKYPPLIFFPGLAGTPKPMAFMAPISTALWGIQWSSENCPKGSLEEMAEFFIRKIKEKQPTGPYRLASYSGTSVILICTVKALESRGEDVAQFVMIDHFPTLFLRNMDPDNSPVQSEDRWKEYYTKTLGGITARLVTSKVEHNSWSPKQLGGELQTFLEDGSETERVRSFNINAQTILRTALEFLLGKQFRKREDDKETWSKTLLFDWMHDIRAPLTVYIATGGFQSEDLSKEHDDLGAREVYPNAKVVAAEGDHFTCIWQTDIAKSLSEGF